MTGQRNEARAELRTNMFVLAAISAGSASGPVKIRNLSPGGATIEGASLPSAGDRIELRRGSGCVCGKVVWRRDGRAGLQFDGRVEVAEWMPGGHVGQQQVDRVLEQLKAGAGGSPPPPPPEQDSPPQDDPLAPAQLRGLARAIDALADDLADDSAVIAKFAAKLQTLDIASQILRKLSDRASSAVPTNGPAALSTYAGRR